MLIEGMYLLFGVDVPHDDLPILISCIYASLLDKDHPNTHILALLLKVGKDIATLEGEQAHILINSCDDEFPYMQAYILSSSTAKLQSLEMT